MSSFIMTIMLLFVIMLILIFINGIKKINFQELFFDEKENKFSHTKFWSNVAYLVSTVAFLYINIFRLDVSNNFIDMIWIIYLGVVAGNASVSKWIAYKYGGRNNYTPYDRDEEIQSRKSYRVKNENEEEYIVRKSRSDY